MVPVAATYLRKLHRHLQLEDKAAGDVVRELQTHVDDRVESLVASGLTEERATTLVLQRLGRPRTLAHLMRQAHLPIPWREALFGAVPSLLVAALVAGRLWPQPVVAAGFAVTVVGVTLYGLWLGRPAWFYPWAGVALTFPAVAGYLAFAALRSVEARDASALALFGMSGAALYFPLGTLVFLMAVLVAARRDWTDASVLLSPLPGALVWLVAVHRAGGLADFDESIRATALLLGLLYCCIAASTMLVLRSRTRELKLTTIVGSAVVLLSIGSLIDEPTGVVTLGLRSVLVVMFLLSPAVAARRA